MNRRDLFKISAGIAIGAGLAGLARQQPAAAPIGVVAPTFDTYASTYHLAFPAMRDHGLVGTFFVEPFQVDRVAGAPTSRMLFEMQFAGWEIGAYSGVNMVKLFAESPQAARDKLLALRERMQKLVVFDSLSLAPNQRAWSPALAELSRGVFDQVRVADRLAVQSLPVAEARNICGGGSPSFSQHDTPAALRAEAIKAAEARGLWLPVLHQVGNDAEPDYSVPVETFRQFCGDLAALVEARAVKVTTFARAIRG